MFGFILVIIRLAAAEAAASRKEVKYSDLPASFSFQPIAVETLGPINESAVDFPSVRRDVGSPPSSRKVPPICSRCFLTVGIFTTES